MRQIALITAQVVGGGLLVVAAVVFMRLGLAHREVAQTTVLDSPLGTESLGSTTSLTILPLYEEAAVDASFHSGHGVSYLITTDETRILMDLGHNPNGDHPAPLLANMQQVGVSPNTADVLFIQQFEI